MSLEKDGGYVMILMACVDQKNGLRFNHRRQSRDRLCRARMLADCGDSPLWLTEQSAALFEEHQQSALRVSRDFLREAGQGEYVFLEAGVPELPRDRLEAVILYRWDKVYPADERLELPEGEWQLISREEFPGSSHAVITRELYRPAL